MKSEPRAEGIELTNTVCDANGFIQKYPLVCGTAESLRAMQEEYVFFTPAILYLHARFIDQPLADFIQLQAPTAKFYYAKWTTQLFAGLEAENKDKAWNHALWAIHIEYWETFLAWMVSLTFTYNDTRDIARVGAQMVTVVDPIAYPQQKIEEVPTLSVWSFGFRGSYVQAALRPDRLPPRLQLLRPDENMRRFADVWYNGCNPLHGSLKGSNRASQTEH